MASPTYELGVDIIPYIESVHNNFNPYCLVPHAEVNMSMNFHTQSLSK